MHNIFTFRLLLLLTTLQVNGTKVSEDPTEVQKWLTNTQGSLMLQILPSFNPVLNDVKQVCKLNKRVTVIMPGVTTITMSRHVTGYLTVTDVTSRLSARTQNYYYFKLVFAYLGN